ncbi:MAG: hypothetical protein M1815_001501 [Lichina confinis]|nr:MAG: hypothetical protein M1815_001501 [Lichina confinis]
MGSLDGGGGALGGGAPIDIVLPTVAGLGGKIESDILGMGPQNGGAGHAPAASPQAAPLGSFVHAIPDRYNPTTALSTALFIQEGSIDFTTRLARVLAKKMQLPVYVGNSISFAAAAGAGGSVEEEIEGFKRCVEIILREVRNKNVKSGRQEKKEERSEERSL